MLRKSDIFYKFIEHMKSHSQLIYAFIFVCYFLRRKNNFDFTIRARMQAMRKCIRPEMHFKSVVKFIINFLFRFRLRKTCEAKKYYSISIKLNPFHFYFTNIFVGHPKKTHFLNWIWCRLPKMCKKILLLCVGWKF
jgi:hypothetical protein